MTRKNVYEIPECELLELKFEADFLDYESQRGVNVEKVTINDDAQWD